jgi:hypothetical protein
MMERTLRMIDLEIDGVVPLQLSVPHANTQPREGANGKEVPGVHASDQNSQLKIEI